ncbi:MAG: hypothetical protein ACE5EK_04510, partial [Nitrospinales bacterium]
TLDTLFLDASGWNGWVQWLALLLSVVWFGLLGTIHGLAAGILKVAGKKLREVVEGVHDLLDLMGSALLAAFPGLEKRIRRQDLEDRIDTLGHQFLNDLKLKRGLFPWIQRMVFMGILKAVKWLFLEDVKEEVRKKGTDEVSRADLESAVRRVGAEMIISNLSDQLFFLHCLNGLGLALTFGLPFLLFWIF